MLLTPRSTPESACTEGAKCWSHGRFTIAWRGYAWYPGQREGEDSISAIGRELHSHSLAELAPRLKGVYGLFVYDHKLREWYITGDPSGLFRIYYSNIVVSTRFLNLCSHIRAKPVDIIADNVIEYIAHGAILGEETFLRQIRVLRDHELISLNNKDGRESLRILSKKSTDPAENPEEILVEIVRGIKESLEGRRLSVDLTGGLDSRILVCLCTNEDLPFETAISGREDNPDVIIARRISEIIGREFYCTPHHVDRLDDELSLVFEVGDAHTDVLHYHRDLQHAKARLNRGINLMMHGGGGEFYRDHSFVHDFPRYGSPHSNLERLYRLRVCPLPIPQAMLTERGRRILSGIEARTIEKFKNYVSSTNNETCERVYLHLRLPEFMGAFYSNYIHLGLDVVAPFFDREAIEGIMRTSPWSRFFALWHRRFLTRRCPTLSRLPTMDGVTASALWHDMLRDSAIYAAIQLRRAARKMTQRYFGRSMFYNVGAFAAHHPDYMSAAFRTRTLERAVDALKEFDILAPDLRPGDINTFHLGRVLTAGLLLDRLYATEREGEEKERQPLSST